MIDARRLPNRRTFCLWIEERLLILRNGCTLVCVRRNGTCREECSYRFPSPCWPGCRSCGSYRRTATYRLSLMLGVRGLRRLWALVGLMRGLVDGLLMLLLSCLRACSCSCNWDYDFIGVTLF